MKEAQSKKAGKLSSNKTLTYTVVVHLTKVAWRGMPLATLTFDQAVSGAFVQSATLALMPDGVRIGE